MSQCSQCGKDLAADKIDRQVAAGAFFMDVDAPEEATPAPLPEPLLEGKPVCRACAHNASHMWALRENEIPCPVMDENGNVIPFGRYPNIDWS